MYLVISGGHPKAAPSEIRPQYLEANMCELVALRHRVQKLNYSIFLWRHLVKCWVNPVVPHYITMKWLFQSLYNIYIYIYTLCIHTLYIHVHTVHIQNYSY